jgi:putative oxidoreductase
MILTDASNRWTNFALLFLRAAFGAAIIYYHGWGKLTDPGAREWLEAQMPLIGLDFLPELWPWASIFAEVVCAGLLILGLLTRPAALILAVDFLIVVIHHTTVEGFNESHPIKLLAVAIFFVLAGAGRYSIDARINR